MKGTLEKRAYELRDIDTNEGVLMGHAAVFDQKTNIADYFYEVIERGAFDNTDFKDVLFSINHDLNKIPLARSRNNNANSTLQLSVDDVGLFMRAKLDLDNNADARALYSAVQRGDIRGMSFIFHVEEERWEDLDTPMPTRYITKIDKVIEVSAVSFPAYEGTDIYARDSNTLDSVKERLDSLKRQKELEEVELLKLKITLLNT